MFWLFPDSPSPLTGLALAVCFSCLQLAELQ